MAPLNVSELIWADSVKLERSGGHGLVLNCQGAESCPQAHSRSWQGGDSPSPPKPSPTHRNVEENRGGGHPNPNELIAFPYPPLFFTFSPDQERAGRNVHGVWCEIVWKRLRNVCARMRWTRILGVVTHSGFGTAETQPTGSWAMKSELNELIWRGSVFAEICVHFFCAFKGMFAKSLLKMASLSVYVLFSQNRK